MFSSKHWPDPNFFLAWNHPHTKGNIPWKFELNWCSRFERVREQINTQTDTHPISLEKGFLDLWYHFSYSFVKSCLVVLTLSQIINTLSPLQRLCLYQIKLSSVHTNSLVNTYWWQYEKVVIIINSYLTCSVGQNQMFLA